MCENFQNCVLICLHLTKHMRHSDYKNVFPTKMVLIVLIFLYNIAQKIVEKLCSISTYVWKNIFSKVNLFFNIILLQLCTLCDTFENLHDFNQKRGLY